MTIEFWLTSPVIFVIGLFVLMCVACFVICWLAHLYHKARGMASDYKTLCQRVQEAL